MGFDATTLTVVAVGLILVLIFAARHLRRRRSSTGAKSGNVVLFETTFASFANLQGSPTLTIRGARDAIERFIRLEEFPALFEGYALWYSPADPTPDLPGEALGVWSRRTCKRFRRILRERGANIELRREPGPTQQVARLVQDVVGVRGMTTNFPERKART